MGKFTDYTGKRMHEWNMIKQGGFNSYGESMWVGRCSYERTEKLQTLSSFKRSEVCSECKKDNKLEIKKKETIGLVFGKLTIIGYHGRREDVKSTSPHWIAKCNCGSAKEIISTLYDIKNGRISSCGCGYIKDPDLSMIGRKFGRLTVIKFENRKDHSHYWNCVCECGTKNIIAGASSLRSGVKRSCGCLKIEVAKVIGEKYGNTRKKYNKFINKDDHYVGITDNGEFLFDEDDYAKVTAIDKYWKINNSNYVLCYLDNKEYQLHRYLMGLGRYDKATDIIVDHKDGNRLNNRKSNLRITHRKNNAINCGLYSSNTSGVKGVSWNKRLNKWQVSIQINKKSIYLGVYVDMQEAIKIRKDAEDEYFGEFKREENFL